MIWALSGEVHSKTNSSLILEVRGVFYEIMMTQKELSKFNLGEEVMIYTREISKENSAIELVGFSNESMRSLYDALIKINGIGPRNALKIMEVTDYETFARAVNSKDISFLKALPSIGAKTAERIVIELSGKLDEVGASASYSGEAVETMIALGFSRAEAFNAVNEAIKKGSRDLEEIVKTALSLIRK